MPNVISTDIHDTWMIDASHEEWTVEKTGSISIDGLAISEDAETGNVVFIRGDIHSETTVEGSTAVESDGHRSKFVVADTSLIDTETGFHFEGGSAHLQNAGLIHVTGTAVLLDESSAQFHLKNSGEITGEVAVQLAQLGNVLNRGEGLISGTDTAIMVADGPNLNNNNTITNKGTISAPVAIDSGDNALLLDNYGTIKGSIEMGSGVLQAEFFDGSVFKGQIGSGDFDATITIHSGAQLSSPLSGLDGNTFYTLFGKVSVAIDENEDGGTDAVATTMKRYHLPDNVENLYMGSLRDNEAIPQSGHGVGNSLDNILMGEKNDILEGRGGNDVLMTYGPAIASVCTLIGGAGDDTFVTIIHRDDTWKTSWDVVQDFIEGEDKIAYVKDDDVTSISDLEIKQHGHDTWIGHNHRNLILKDVDASTLTSDDFQFGYQNLYDHL